MAHKVGRGRPTPDIKHKWITKKEKPNWITKKEKPKAWITKKKQQSEPRDEQTPSAGRAKHNIGGRANLLEEMGRIDARKHPDAADRSEKRRVIGELNKGYKSGGAVLKGKKVGIQIK
jgi:hypothetical protein